MKYSDIQNLAEQLLKAGQAIEKLVKSVALYKGDVLRPKFGQPKVDKPVEQKVSAPTLKNTPDSLKAEREEHNKAVLRSLRVGDEGRKAHPRELKPGQETRIRDIQPSKLSAKDKLLNNNILQAADSIMGDDNLGSQEHHDSFNLMHYDLSTELYDQYAEPNEDEDDDSIDEDARSRAENEADEGIWNHITYSDKTPQEKRGIQRAFLSRALADLHPGFDMVEFVNRDAATPHLPYLANQMMKNPTKHVPALSQLKNDDRLDEQSRKKIHDALHSVGY